jgi:pimeloyl-ACP methyl ester carboxylesterase
MDRGRTRDPPPKAPAGALSLNRTPVTATHRGCTLSGFVDGAGPPVVMIQGVGIGANGWLPQIGGLANGYRCLAFDPRGFGRSQPAAEPLTLELMAEDVLALMDAQGFESAHLVGHSMGGLIALYVAHAARTRVRSLSLLCSFASGAVPTRLTPGMAAIGLRTRIGTRRMRRNAFLELVMPPDALVATDRDALAERLATLFGHDLADQPPIVMKQLSAMRRADATSFLPLLVDIPTLIVNAAHDRIAPVSAGRALAAGIPGSRYVERTDASHGVTIQYADWTNELLRHHLNAHTG